jgi:hypothetical protein
MVSPAALGYLTCIHEAGHCVACLIWDGRAPSVWARDGEGETTGPPLAGSVLAAAAALSGGAAVLAAIGSPDRLECTMHDLFGGDDLRRAEALGETQLGEAADLAADLAAHYLPAIMDLANWLWQLGEMDSDEVAGWWLSWQQAAGA